MAQENASDRKHRLKTDGLGNQDEEVFAIHTCLGGGFIDDKKWKRQHEHSLMVKEVLVKRSWLLESPFPSFSTMSFMQTKDTPCVCEHIVAKEKATETSYPPMT